MRQEWESSTMLLVVRRAWWLVALTCIAAAGLSPAAGLAQPAQQDIDKAIEQNEETIEEMEESAAEMRETAAAAEAAVMSEEEALDMAEEMVREAEEDLEEAKRALQLAGRKLAPEPDPIPGVGPGFVSADGRAKKLQVSLNEDGTLYFRFATWLQVWGRAMQLNPGSEVTSGPGITNDDPWAADVGLRRARFLMFGQIFPRVFLMMHIGINNQTFLHRDFKQAVFFHDAWVEFQVTKGKQLYIGGGLLYWNGISRLTNASTITLMTLDAPIMNWPLIEVHDQFARQMGFYAKGKLGLFDYRVAVTRPKQAQTGQPDPNADPAQACCVGGYNAAHNTWAYQGYFMLQFLDEESNVLPYTVGTYIGAKRVLNLGFGGYVHPLGSAYLTEDNTVRQVPLWVASGDFFFDIPTGDRGNALTGYAAYYHHQMGPDYVRNVGIMPIASGGTGLAPGNAYPIIGTGNHVYANFGWLMPGDVGAQKMKFQPYVHTQISKFQGLDAAMFWFGAGMNMFIHRHNAKVTLEYRNRPVYAADGSYDSRKGNSFILQLHLFI